MSPKDKLGRCMLCGRRVTTKDNYVVSEEGYCHNSCLHGAEILA